MILCNNLECTKGYFRDVDKCTLCPVGTYSDTDDAESCTNCATGQTTSQRGSDQSSLCHIGKKLKVFPIFQRMMIINNKISLIDQNYIKQFLLQQIECIKGYFRNGEKCTLCPIGTYSDVNNVETCTSCPEGQTTSQEGSHHSSQCQLGKMSTFVAFQQRMKSSFGTKCIQFCCSYLSFE